MPKKRIVNPLDKVEMEMLVVIFMLPVKEDTSAIDSLLFTGKFVPIECTYNRVKED